MPLPFGVLKVADLNSVNFALTGSKRSAPSGADDQISPLPSQSTVVAPPVGDMPVGGRNTSIFSVLGSRRPRPPRPVLTLNQMMPLASRVMPWVCAARPLGAASLNSLTSPLLVSILPMVVRLFGILQVNQSCPSRSSHASCTPQPGMRTDGVPSDQSLPSFWTKLLGRPESGSSGTSYSLNMTRADSPDGRGSGLNFIAPSPGPRARAR